MRNSPRDPLDTASEPSYSGSARVPARPTVAVTVPATPLVSCSSRAYTPASGNPSIWRCASARPRVGRSPFRTRRPESRTLRSAAAAPRLPAALTVTWVGPSHNDAPPGQARGVGARLHGHRIERTLQGEQDARRALERAPAPHGRGVAPNDPGHERVERVEAVGVEIEREHAPGRAPPPEGTGPGRDEPRLRHAQRVDVQPTA